MDKKLKEQLRSIKNENGRLNPSGVWVSENRAQLINKISTNQQFVREKNIATFFDIFKGFVPQTIKVAARPVMIILLVTAISATGWGATVSADYSLPGDALYGVKRAKEKTQQVVGKLVGGSEGEAKMLFDQKKNRAVETAALIQQNTLDKVGETLDELSKTADKLHKIVEDTGNKDTKIALKIATESVKATEDVDNILKAAQKNTTDVGLAEKIIETKKEVTEKTIDGVGSVVEKTKDDASLTDEDRAKVGELVKKTIENLTKDAAATVKATAGLSDSTVASSALSVKVSSSTLNIVVGDTLGSTSTVKTLSTISGSSSSTTQTVEEFGEVAKEGLEEAKQLAEAGQFTEALQVAKDANSLMVDIDISITKAVSTQQTTTNTATSTTTSAGTINVQSVTAVLDGQ